MRDIIIGLLTVFLTASPVMKLLSDFVDNQTTIYGGLVLNPGWTILQDIPAFNCSAGNAGCAMGGWQPTTAGSVWGIFVSFGNLSGTGEHMTSVTGSSGTWTHCPGGGNGNCNSYDSVGGGVDAMFNFTGTAGQTSASPQLSVAATGFFYGEFVEALPPPGYSCALGQCSLDASGSTTNANCSTTCNGVPLTLTATDMVFQITNAPNFVAPAGPFAWSSPYAVNGASSGFAQNVNSVPGTPTFGLDPLSNPGIQPHWIGVVALAFKTTAGLFSVPPPLFTFAGFASSYTITGTDLNCTPTCPAFSIPNVPAGATIFVHEAAANSTVLSTSTVPTDTGGDTFTVPTGAGTCAKVSGILALSCSFVMTANACASSCTITFTASSTNHIAVAVYIVTRSSGTSVLDAQGSTINPSSVSIPGQSLGPGCTGCSNSITGTNDVFFAAAIITGGPTLFSIYPQPFINTGHNSQGGGQTFLLNTADTGILLNSKNTTPPATQGPLGVSVVSNVAIK